MARLKVFRSPAGFHDAYVAAPSRKAALAAWGADADLFARGVAEEVTDPALMAAPLAKPGKVIRVARGTADEHLAALSKSPKRQPPARNPAATARAEPRPSRADLDAAEASFARAEQAHKARLRDLADREAALAGERREAERDHAREMDRLENERGEAKAAYDRAIEAWST